MRRIVVLAALAGAVLGCEKAVEKGGLTRNQKADWEAKRKEVADYPYMIVGYDADEKAWMCYCLTDPGLVRYGWKQTVVDLWRKDEMDGAKLYTERAADNPRIAAVALVDLVSEEKPKPVMWYFKDGEVMKRTKGGGAPRADLGVGIKEYLYKIQTNPDVVKIPAN